MILIEIGPSEAKSLTKQVEAPRQEIYRALEKLQERGIVEKIIASPLKYQAIPIEELYLNIVKSKANEYKKILEKTQYLLNEYKTITRKQQLEQDYKISIVEGKETILNRCKIAHANAMQNVRCCSTFQRWIQVGQEISDTIQKTLARGVEYRLVLEKTNSKICLPKEVKELLAHENFQVKITYGKLKSNAVIFDDKLSSFSFYPSKSIPQSPMVWTNHPSIVESFQDHFRKMWKNSKIASIEDVFY